MLKKYWFIQPDFWLDGWTPKKIKGLRAFWGWTLGWTTSENGWTLAENEVKT